MAFISLLFRTPSTGVGSGVSHGCFPLPLCLKTHWGVGKAVVLSRRLWGNLPLRTAPGPCPASAVRACANCGVGSAWGKVRERARPLTPQALGAAAPVTTTGPKPAPHQPPVIPARPGPRVRGPGSPAGLTEDAAKRPLPYLRVTRSHLVWRLFGHAAADPGHARHLAAAVHDSQLKDASQPQWNRTPASLRASRPGTSTGRLPRQSAGAGPNSSGVAPAYDVISRRPMGKVGGLEAEAAGQGNHVGWVVKGVMRIVFSDLYRLRRCL